jgi:biotin transport system substrate-specific component
MRQTNTAVLIDQFTRERSAALDLLWIVGFSLLTALAAQIEFRLPFMPVPWTGQTFAVLLSGAVLGSRRGFASQLLYLAQGAAGLPVFAGGGFSVAFLLGPTGGYLWSFPVAAALVGLAVEKGAGRSVWRLALVLVAADAVILTSGAAWLRALLGCSLPQAFTLGFYPFLIGDMLKVALAALVLPMAAARYERSAK